jgi:hypothetical protein
MSSLNKISMILCVISTALIANATEIEVMNPSFEQGTGGYWINKPSAVIVDSTDSTKGRQCLRYKEDGAGRVDVVFFVEYHADKVYELSFDMKGDGKVNGPSLKLELMLQASKPLLFWKPSGKAKEQFDRFVPEKDWTRKTITFGPVPTEARGQKVTKIAVYLRREQGTEPGNIWIDNISVELKDVKKQVEDISFILPDPVQIYESVPGLKIARSEEFSSFPMEVSIKDFRGTLINKTAYNAGTETQVKLPGEGYYEVEAVVMDKKKVLKKINTSLVVTTPLPDDYYTTPHPAFGVWCGMSPQLRRLGGAKWDRQLFFTFFQKPDFQAMAPAAAAIASREPVNIIRCLNVLNPFKKMVPVTKSEWSELRERLRKDIVSRKGLVDVWETQNEPMVGENFHGTMTDVMDIIRNTSEVVRSIDPDTPIAGICINPMSSNQYNQYVGYYKNHNIGRYVDAVMLHPYIPNAMPPDVSGYVETLERLAADIKKITGEDIPMYVSEVGYSTKPGGEVSELQQGAYLARVVLLNRRIKDLKACVWHNGLWNEATSRRELDFGILRGHPKNSPLREPKPAFAAWATVSRMTYNAEYIRDLEMGRGLRVLLFDRQGVPLIVAYSLSATKQQLRIPLGVDAAVITDMCGTSKTKELPDGIVTLELDEAPVYISGGNIHNFINDNMFSIDLTPAVPRILPGEDITVSLQGSPGMWDDNAKLRIDMPEKWTQHATRKTHGWDIHIGVPQNTLPGTHQIFYDIRENGKSKYIRQQHIEIIPPVDILVCKPENSGGKAVRLTLRRNKKNTGRVSVAIVENDKNIIGKGVITQNDIVSLPLKGVTYGRKNRYSARMSLNNNYSWTQELPDVAPVLVEHKGVDSSASLGSWGVSSTFTLADGTYSEHSVKGEKDLPEGKLYLCWDEKYLYLGMSVKDKYHRPAANVASLWSGDSLQIGISVDKAAMIRSNNDGIQETAYAEIGVMPVAGNNSWVWASMNRTLMELHNQVPELLNHSKHENGMTEYRIAIPWRSLNIKTPMPGTALRLSILVNDRDEGERHWLEWYSGIASGKDPAMYGSMVLVK